MFIKTFNLFNNFYLCSLNTNLLKVVSNSICVCSFNDVHGTCFVNTVKVSYLLLSKTVIFYNI